MFNFNLNQLLKDFEKSLGFKNEIKWNRCISIILYHLVGVIWCYLYAFPAKWQTLAHVFALHVVFVFGITAGAHRYWTHRSFKAKYPLQLIMLLCHTSAGHISVIQWVLDHRLHHKYSDTDADPHNSKRGLFFSHIGWLMMKKNDEVLKHGKKIDMSDLYSDPIITFQHKHFGILKLVLCYIIPTVTCILLWDEDWKCAVAWQCFIRYLVLFHTALTVNSVAHAFGKRPYNAKIMPTENRLVSFVSLGEGWHNYHHQFPFDYKASETIDFLDLSTWILRFFAMIGWAYEMKEATPEMIRSVAEKTGDGSILRVKKLEDNKKVDSR